METAKRQPTIHEQIKKNWARLREDPGLEGAYRKLDSTLFQD
jgi:hypothetical protein